MKFGKTLSEMVKVEWKEYAVNYRGLKKCLPRDEVDVDPTVTSFPEFWEIFQSSKASVAMFYSNKKDWAEGQVFSLENQVERLKLSNMPGSNLNSTLDVTEVYANLEKFNTEVGYVNEFLNINHTAFRKILKKYDKRTGSTLQTTKLQEVVKECPFLDGSAMDDIYQRVQLLIETLGEIKQLPKESSLRKSRKRQEPVLRTASFKMISASNEFIERMMENSPLFTKCNAKVVPNFEIGEIEFGDELGEGEFSVVHEIKNFAIDDSCPICVIHDFPEKIDKDTVKCVEVDSNTGSVNSDTLNKLSKTSKLGMQKNVGTRRRSSFSNDNLDMEDQESYLIDHVDEDQEFFTSRGFMKHHCFRNGSARYAIKQLKKSLKGDKLADGAIDICIESKFLSVLAHPNIIKLCGTGGIPGHQSAFIVLDRLYHTLGTKIDEWKTIELKNKGFCRLMNKKPHSLQLLWNERLLAVYDVACAMQYLHHHQIMYRDLKPENIGFDVRGTAKVFDFGLSKELLAKDKIGENQYNASGRTGTRRYMAPEVVLCKYYGKPVDVYSFAIVFWQTLSLDIPFDGYDYEKHSKNVVQKHKRPSLGRDWPTLVKRMIKSAWDNDPRERPNFDQICAMIRGELHDHIDVAARTQNLLDGSRTFH